MFKPLRLLFAFACIVVINHSASAQIFLSMPQLQDKEDFSANELPADAEGDRFWSVPNFRLGALGSMETQGSGAIPDDPAVGLMFEYNAHWNYDPEKWFQRLTGYASMNTAAGSDTLAVDSGAVESMVFPGAANTVATVGIEASWNIDRKPNEDNDFNELAGYLEFSQRKYTVRDISGEGHSFTGGSLDLGIRLIGTSRIGEDKYGRLTVGGFWSNVWIDPNSKPAFQSFYANLGTLDAPTAYRGFGIEAKAQFNQFGAEFRWVNLNPSGIDSSEEIPGITGNIFIVRSTFTGNILGG